MYTLGKERESSNDSKCICKIIENRVSRTLFIVAKVRRWKHQSKDLLMNAQIKNVSYKHRGRERKCYLSIRKDVLEHTTAQPYAKEISQFTRSAHTMYDSIYMECRHMSMSIHKQRAEIWFIGIEGGCNGELLQLRFAC